MGKVLKQSFWTTIIIYLGVLLGFINSLILFPNYLSTEQIGLIRQIISASSILIPLTTFGVSATYLKFYPNFKNDNRLKNEFLSIQFFFIIISFVIICSLLILFSDNIKKLAHNSSKTSLLKLLDRLSLPSFELCSFLMLSFHDNKLFFLINSPFNQSSIIGILLITCSLIDLYFFSLIPFVKLYFGILVLRKTLNY